MRIDNHRLIRPFAVGATTWLTAMVVALAFGPGVGLAADEFGLEDAKYNVCEGGFTSPDCPKVTGERNIALGDSMLPALTNGDDNIALDFGALEADTTGSDNIASGNRALAMNTEGNDNIASGSGSLTANTTGDDNVATGIQALESNTTGNFNVAVGLNALLFDKTANNNVASGHEALEKTTGAENVGLGFRAGKALTTGTNNIDIANEGVAGEKRTIRIGIENEEARAFMAGIYEKTIKEPVCTVKVNSAGQLGCKATPVSHAASSPVSTQLKRERAQVTRQQREIDRLAGELQSLRREMLTRR